MLIGNLIEACPPHFRGRLVLKSEALVRLVDLESADRLSALPSAAKRGIAKALVLAGGACEDQASPAIQDDWYSRFCKLFSTSIPTSQCPAAQCSAAKAIKGNSQKNVNLTYCNFTVHFIT